MRSWLDLLRRLRPGIILRRGVSILAAGWIFNANTVPPQWKKRWRILWLDPLRARCFRWGVFVVPSRSARISEGKRSGSICWMPGSSYSLSALDDPAKFETDLEREAGLYFR